MIRTLRTLCLFFPLSIALAEPLMPVAKEQENLGWITGFHSHFDELSKHEFRVLEMDGSATVASNPVYLYLVVTDNVENTKVLKLPSIASIKEIRFFKGNRNIEIEGTRSLLDVHGNVVDRPETIVLPVLLKDGKLPEKFEVDFVKPAIDKKVGQFEFPRDEFITELAEQKKYYVKLNIPRPVLITNALDAKEPTDTQLLAAVLLGRQIMKQNQNE